MKVSKCMSFVNCPHCGKFTFRLDDWADLDHCAHCGKPLAHHDEMLENVLNERRRPRSARRFRPPGKQRGRHEPTRRRVASLKLPNAEG